MSCTTRAAASQYRGVHCDTYSQDHCTWHWLWKRWGKVSQLLYVVEYECFETVTGLAFEHSRVWDMVMLTDASWDTTAKVFTRALVINVLISRCKPHEEDGGGGVSVHQWATCLSDLSRHWGMLSGENRETAVEESRARVMYRLGDIIGRYWPIKVILVLICISVHVVPYVLIWKTGFTL